MLDQRSILVTGGTGSFGKLLVQEILRRFESRRLVVFSRDEQKQYQMAQRFSPEEYPCLRYFIGDVRDADRLRRAMDGIDYVVHAAAMKHVPIAEYNPFECIRTNIGGAENVINAAIDCNVKRVVALSTDKAANPINLYGATKLASDKCFIAANHLSASSATRFAVVRYGNVIGSRGSVVEFFGRLIDEGERCLPITDYRMTRFWLTLERGVDVVLSSLANMSGGELFIPKIPSMYLKDLAGAVARSKGVDAFETREIGIRPGEKLHEVLLPYDEARNTLEFDDHYTVHPAFSWWKREDHMNEGGEVGRPIECEDFQYRSNNKDNDWLTEDDLCQLLQKDRFDGRARTHVA